MSMFENLTAAEAPKKTPKGKKAKREVAIKGMEQYAAVQATVKALEGVGEALKAKVNAQSRKFFVAEGVRIAGTPESFNGVEGKAKGSCQLRKRSTRSALTPDDIALLDDFNIPYDEEEQVAERIVFNPTHAANADVMAKVEKALKNIKGLPADLFQRQAGVTKKVVTEETLRSIFTSKQKAEALIDVVGTLAIRPSIAGDAVDAIEIVKEMLKA